MHLYEFVIKGYATAEDIEEVFLRFVDYQRVRNRYGHFCADEVAIRDIEMFEERYKMSLMKYCAKAECEPYCDKYGNAYEPPYYTKVIDGSSKYLVGCEIES